MLNELYRPGFSLPFICSHPTTPKSGDPVRIGKLTGIAETDENATTGETTVYIGPGVYSLSVKAVDDAGNSAIAKGDRLYYVDADTPALSKKSSGVFFGWAKETVNAGATATIEVIHGLSDSTSQIVEELGLLDGAVPGTLTASKVLVADENKEIDEIKTAKINGQTLAAVIATAAAAVAKIADPTAGGTVDAQARTAIGLIIDALEAFGIAADA